MKKSIIRASIIGSSAAAILTLASGGMASAASINITGPGSTNIIRSSGWSMNNASIYLTGPDSTNIITSSNSHKSNNYGNNSHNKNYSNNYAVWASQHYSQYHMPKQQKDDCKDRPDRKTSYSNKQNKSYGSSQYQQSSKKTYTSHKNYGSNNYMTSYQNSNSNNYSSNYGMDRSNRHVTITDTDVSIHASNNQNVRSGDVTASHNTVVGDVYSGSASASARNDINVSVN
ncbi:MAG: hypothetical protein JWS12_66 [Candidatus Saccharibacteria bacterium]|nr:hypothetical protein [Candidatus Saccharibacteria bacterium]